MQRVLVALLVTACASPASEPPAEAAIVAPPAAPVVAPPAAPVVAPPAAPVVAPPAAPVVAPAAPAAPPAPAPSGPIIPSGSFDRALHPLSPDQLDCIEMVSSCNAAGTCTSMPVYIACGATSRVGTETLGCICP